MPIQFTHSTGMLGQQKAMNHYLKNTYCLIDENFQYYQKGTQGRTGEIDLIFERKHVLYFIEVTTRTTAKFSVTQEPVSESKLKTLYGAIQYFLMKKPQYKEYGMQFDVAVINNDELEVIPNAYTFDGFES
jgi:putative endonuclease